MLKNTGSQTICFQAVSTTDGSAVTTGTPTVYVLGDGGTQTSGGGTKTHEGQGTWSYVPSAGETNYSHVVYTMVLSGAINHAINVYPSTFDYTASLTDSTIADQVWDETQSTHTTAGSFGELATEIANIEADTNELQGDWTNTGRLDTILDSINAASAPTAAAIADAVWDETQASHTTGGTFGEIATEIDNIHADTADMQPKLGTPVVSLAADLAAVDVDVNAVLDDTSTTIPGLIPTVNQIADQVWDESQSGHVGAGTFGYYLDQAISGVSTGGVTPAEIADAVWDEIANLHLTVGSFGKLADDILTDTGTSIPNSISNLNDVSVAAVADGVWDEATAGHTTSGTFGEQVKTDIDSILVETATNIPADIAALSIPSAASVADAVWDETQAGHVTAGTFGLYLDAQVSSASTPPTALAIADAVWDEAQSAHVTAGTFGVIATEIADILTDTGTTLPATLSSLNDIAVATVVDAVWDEPTSGHTTSGTFGEQVKTDIDAILLDTADMQPRVASVETDVTAILEDTGTTLDTLVTNIDTNVTAIPGLISALNNVSTTQVSTAVWGAAHASYAGAGTFGEQCGVDIDAILADTDELQTDDIPTTLAGLNDISVGDIWDEAQAGHVTAGTFGLYLDQTVSTAGGGGLTTGGIADAVWDEAMTGHTTTGTAGAVYDFASDLVKTDVIEINSVANAASQLALSAGQIITGTVDTVTNTHTPTVTEFQADDITEATADHYNSRVLIFTSGTLAGQATAITDYVAAGGIGSFTVVEMTEAPANDDTFIIV